MTLLDCIPLDRFEVIERLGASDMAVHLRLKTERGPKTLWCPRKLLCMNTYGQGGRIITEAWIASALAEKAGLA